MDCRCDLRHWTAVLEAPVRKRAIRASRLVRVSRPEPARSFRSSDSSAVLFIQVDSPLKAAQILFSSPLYRTGPFGVLAGYPLYPPSVHHERATYRPSTSSRIRVSELLQQQAAIWAHHSNVLPRYSGGPWIVTKLRLVPHQAQLLTC